MKTIYRISAAMIIGIPAVCLYQMAFPNAIAVSHFVIGLAAGFSTYWIESVLKKVDHDNRD